MGWVVNSTFQSLYPWWRDLVSIVHSIPCSPSPNTHYAPSVQSIQYNMKWKQDLRTQFIVTSLLGKGGGVILHNMRKQMPHSYSSIGHTAHMHIIYIFSSNSAMFHFTGQNLCSCFWCMLYTAWCYTITQELKSGHKNCQYHVVNLCQRKNQHWFHIDTLRKIVHADQVIPVHLQLQLITNSISTQSKVSRGRFRCDYWFNLFSVRPVKSLSSLQSYLTTLALKAWECVSVIALQTL